MLLSCLIFVLIAVGAAVGQDACYGGMVWTSCGSPCNKTCTDRSPVCAEVCMPRCECRYDTYWDGSTCISDFECNDKGLYDRMTTPRWWERNTTTTMAPTSQNCSRCMAGACDMYGECSYGCADGMYGYDCSMYCAMDCLYRSCDRDSGYCMHGCVNGTDGPYCEDKCKMGCNNGYGCMYDQGAEYGQCPWSTCYDCGCQGYECIIDPPSAASMPAGSLFVLMCLAFLHTMLG